MSAGTPPLPGGVRTVREPLGPDPAVPLYSVPEWRERFPWLVHGTTGRGGDHSFDLGLFGETPVGTALGRWRALRDRLAVPRAVHSRQVHGPVVMEHGDPTPGLYVTEGRDGHVTGTPGILLTVSLADCVPISLVDPRRRRVALLHGGWRGTAAEIVGRGLDLLGSDPSDLHAHLGPAICGRCYEVGPEVHQALGLPVPAHPSPVDVRAVQATELVEAGVAAERITVSGHCTLCGDGFFSHRGGSTARQLGVLAIR